MPNIQLVNLTKDDLIECICEAVNGVGYSIRRTHVNIQYPLRIVSASFPDTTYTVTDYSIKNLDVTIDSNIEYNATWYFSKDN